MKLSKKFGGFIFLSYLCSVKQINRQDDDKKRKKGLYPQLTQCDKKMA